MRIYLLIAAIAGGVTWLVTPLIRHVAIEIGAVGEVRARDVHTIPTPRMGGLGMPGGMGGGHARGRTRPQGKKRKKKR